ncbi:MAG: putative baseplate assembly protein [Ktedonobacteraceae bacterium]
MKITTICQDTRQRRHKIRERNAAEKNKIYALDYVDVGDDYHTLTVYFLGKAPRKPNEIQKENVRIAGGQRIRDIKVESVRVHHETGPERDDYMQVVVDKPGDYSTYTLSLGVPGIDVHGHPVFNPFEGFDSRYAQVDFTFTAGCSSDLDCQPEDTCPPPMLVEPEISYLAKDYASFRQLILDRLALVMPDWNERHVPDLGITLVEILAYAGDYLSYFQDAVATEAYLETARQRISVRRHVRLVDYQMHEGCNARTWVDVKVSGDLTLKNKNALDPCRIYFITGTNDLLQVSGSMLTDKDLLNIPPSSYEVFEPVKKDAIELYKAHNIIDFYTWEDEQCCLPRGTTSATLRDHWVPPPAPPGETSAPGQATPPGGNVAANVRQRRLNLHPGDFLIFEERIGPRTGLAADADPKHRHVVRLTTVTPNIDDLYDRPLVEITWAQEDALPFPLCLSAIGQAPECKLLKAISIARGNVMLVDHGRRIADEAPVPNLVVAKETTPVCDDVGHAVDSETVPDRFNPKLQSAPLTFSVPLPPATSTPAAQLLTQDPRQALPQVVKLLGARTISGQEVAEEWHPQPDLLASTRLDRDYVVEMDNDGVAHLRFGDGNLGHMPEVDTTFTATYRVGNGSVGNVGSGTITHIVFRAPTPVPSGITLEPYNPLPASGGIDPEPLDEVKLFAPGAFRTDLQRAIAEDDYARLAERNPKVQRAAAMLFWTGSWYEVIVAIDPKGSESASPALLREIKGYLYPYRRIGHDVTVVPATYVPLNINITVCVDQHYLRGHVKAALLNLLSNRVLPNGQLGFFHPDNLTFGQGISMSRLIALIQSVPGVQTLKFNTFERLFGGPHKELENEFLPIGPMEIAQLDNDPSFPEHGKLVLDMRGGR